MHVHAFILIKFIKVPIIKQKITIRHYSFKNDDAGTGLIIYTSFESVLYLLYFVKIYPDSFKAGADSIAILNTKGHTTIENFDVRVIE